MAYGNKSNHGLETLYSFRLVTKQGVTPHFSVSKKDKETGKWNNDVDKCSFIEGRLDSVFHREWEYEGDPMHTVTLYLVDNEERYKVDLTLTILVRGLLNSLMNIDKNKAIHMSVYEVEGDDHKKRARIALRQNDELVSWKYSREELPEPKEYRDEKGKLIKRDWTKSNDFILEKLDETFDVRGYGSDDSSGSSDDAPQNAPDPDEVGVGAGSPEDEVPF